MAHERLIKQIIWLFLVLIVYLCPLNLAKAADLTLSLCASLIALEERDKERDDSHLASTPIQVQHAGWLTPVNSQSLKAISQDGHIVAISTENELELRAVLTGELLGELLTFTDPITTIVPGPIDAGGFWIVTHNTKSQLIAIPTQFLLNNDGSARQKPDFDLTKRLVQGGELNEVTAMACAKSVKFCAYYEKPNNTENTDDFQVISTITRNGGEIVEGIVSYAGRGHPTLIRILEDASLMAVATSEGIVYVWDLGQRDNTPFFQTAPYSGSRGSSILDVAFSDDPGWLAISTLGDDTSTAPKVEVLSIERNIQRISKAPQADKKTLKTGTKAVHGRSTAITTLQSYPDGSLLATGGANGSIVIWRTNGAIQCKFPAPKGAQAVTDISFSDDGVHLTALHTDGAVRLWEIPEGDKPKGNLLYELSHP